MNIPFLDLKAQYASIKPEIDDAVHRVIESQHFILGPEVESLESEVAEYCGCRFAIGVSSGTDALLSSLMSLEIGPGEEVITSAYSFFATAGCLARVGARPVFVDIDPVSFNLDPNQLEDAVNRRTRAIIPVHLFGLMADMEPILSIANRHDLMVIEDAAQAIGADTDGRRAGSIGHLGCLSFFPSKNLGGFGDGGMVVTNDEKLAARLKIYRNQGFGPKYFNRVVGGNFRLDALQAAVLRVKLKHLPHWTECRRRNAERYRALFERSHLFNVGKDPSRSTKPSGLTITLPFEKPRQRHVYNQYVIRVPQRRAGLQDLLQSRGIGSAVYYPLPLQLQECFANLGYQPGDLPQSELAARETLALPIYPELSNEMIKQTVTAIGDFAVEEASLDQ